ncbi:hypothetical protein BGZ54_005410 [Gamsiella multidivaricata]|nr:hypothetical protein BGZ54_005410 [Gamsiella multidivaricata]
MNMSGYASSGQIARPANQQYDYHRRPHPGLAARAPLYVVPTDGSWNPGSSRLVGSRVDSPQSPQQHNGYNNGYNGPNRPYNYNYNYNYNNSGGILGQGLANPIDRNTILNNHREYQQSLFAQNLAQVESALDAMRLSGYRTNVYRTTPTPRQHRGPPLFNQAELDLTRRRLEEEYNHFTFLQNKGFYKPMSLMIDYVERDPLLEAFSRMRPPPLPKDMDLTRWEYVKSCTPIQMSHLKLFNRLPREMPQQYKASFRRAVDHVTALMKLPEKLPMPTMETLANVRYDGSKFAGLDYARQMLKTRKEAHVVALEDAKLVWEALMAGHRVRPHDARLGGKGKLIEKLLGQHGRVDDDVGMGRLILMLSHRDLLILGSLEQPLTASYLDAQWPIYIGQSWYHGGAERFVNKMGRHAVYHCFDAKKFDAAIDGWLVKEALLILRQQYEGGMDPKYDTLWSFVYESLIEVVICRDDGIRMQKHVGTTSGNCFNTLVQSIITMFLGYTALIVKAQERMGSIGVEMILTQCEIEVLGDDMVMALETPWMFLTKETLAAVVLDCFNIDWSGKKSFTTNHLMDNSLPDTDRFKGIQFLGMYFRHQRWGEGRYAPKIVVPYRPFKESYLSLLFPKYGEYSREHSWLRAIGIYLNAAGNPDTQEWLEAYMDFLELVPFVRPEVWPPNMEKLVTKDFWSLGTKPPLPARISVQEWMRMTCLARAKDGDE